MSFGQKLLVLLGLLVLLFIVVDTHFFGPTNKPKKTSIEDSIGYKIDRARLCATNAAAIETSYRYAAYDGALSMAILLEADDAAGEEEFKRVLYSIMYETPEDAVDLKPLRDALGKWKGDFDDIVDALALTVNKLQSHRAERYQALNRQGDRFVLLYPQFKGKMVRAVCS